MMLLEGVLLIVCCLCRPVLPHGWLEEPPARSSMWRVGFNTPVNYDDNGLNCGGWEHLIRLGGKCGICGDPYDGPRENEAGGRYATGTISRFYKEGETIHIKVVLTATHGGFFEFKLCANNNVSKVITQECLDKHLLERADDPGKTRYTDVGTGGYLNPQTVELMYRLPVNLTCEQCVLQWKYVAAQNVGFPKQEEFYGCSDIAIVSNLNGSPPTPGSYSNTPMTTFHETSLSRETTAIGISTETTTARETSNSDKTRAVVTTPTPQTSRQTTPQILTQITSQTSKRITPQTTTKPTTKTSRQTTQKTTQTTPPTITPKSTTQTTKQTLPTTNLRTAQRTPETTAQTPTHAAAQTTTKTATQATSRSSLKILVTSTERTILTPSVTERSYNMSLCQAVGVLKGNADQLCRDACVSVSSCVRTFCNHECLRIAEHRDLCRSMGNCSLDNN